MTSLATNQRLGKTRGTGWQQLPTWSETFVWDESVLLCSISNHDMQSAHVSAWMSELCFVSNWDASSSHMGPASQPACTAAAGNRGKHFQPECLLHVSDGNLLRINR